MKKVKSKCIKNLFEIFQSMKNIKNKGKRLFTLKFGKLAKQNKSSVIPSIKKFSQGLKNFLFEVSLGSSPNQAMFLRFFRGILFFGKYFGRNFLFYFWVWKVHQDSDKFGQQVTSGYILKYRNFYNKVYIFFRKFSKIFWGYNFFILRLSLKIFYLFWLRHVALLSRTYQY